MKIGDKVRVVSNDEVSSGWMIGTVGTVVDIHNEFVDIESFYLNANIPEMRNEMYAGDNQQARWFNHVSEVEVVEETPTINKGDRVRVVENKSGGWPEGTVGIIGYVEGNGTYIVEADGDYWWHMADELVHVERVEVDADELAELRRKAEGYDNIMVYYKVRD